jgi:hypothetical protein
MRTLLSLAAFAFLAACSSSTEPSKAGDPSLLFTNNLDHDYVYVTWQDGNAIFGRDSIAPRTANQCVRFTAQPDSARWVITAGETSPGSPTPTTSQGGNWFNPEDRPAWNVVVNPGSGGGGPQIVAAEIDPSLAC